MDYDREDLPPTPPRSPWHPGMLFVLPWADVDQETRERILMRREDVLSREYEEEVKYLEGFDFTKMFEKKEEEKKKKTPRRRPPSSGRGRGRGGGRGPPPPPPSLGGLTIR